MWTCCAAWRLLWRGTLPNQALFELPVGAAAEAKTKKSLSSIDEKVYGPDHPEVAADLNNEAMLLWIMVR